MICLGGTLGAFALASGEGSGTTELDPLHGSGMTPAPTGTLLARMRIVLPRLVLSAGEARALDFRIRSNAFDNRYPPEAAATFRWPLPGQSPNSPMMSEFFSGGFVLGKAENLEGHSRPGDVAVVVWVFERPEGAFRSLRALRDLSGLHAKPSSFAPGAVLLSFPGTGVSDLLWVRGRALVRTSSGVAQGGKSMAGARERVARAVDAKISAEPSVGGIRLQPAKRPDRSTLAGRLGSLRIAENDLPGGLDTESWRVRARRDARDRLHDDTVAVRLGRHFRALGLLGGASQVVSVAQIHGVYVTYAWAFSSARAARAALRAAASQRGVRAAPANAVRARDPGRPARRAAAR